MKKNNKGFSLVELIIVIAIMAILAGALAPALIKYINKSRASADISNADTIRSAIQTTLSNEEAMVDAPAASTGYTITALTNEATYDEFAKELKSILGDKTSLTCKYYGKGSEFTVDIDTSDNKVIVKGADGSQLSPQ